MPNKYIFCPSCGEAVGKVNLLSSIPFPMKCNKCKKLVVYYGDEGRVVMKDIPDRNTSSGKRFY